MLIPLNLNGIHLICLTTIIKNKKKYERKLEGNFATYAEIPQILSTFTSTYMSDCSKISLYCQDRLISKSMKYLCDRTFDLTGCFTGCECSMKII